MSQATRTTLNRTWLIKMAVFFAFLAGLGAWGYYDATVKWPARGVQHADWAKWQYVRFGLEIGRASRTSVTDPVAEFERLSEPTKLAEISAAQGSVGGSETDEFEFLRYVWLRSLSRVGRLDAEFTTIADARQSLNDLNEVWLSSNAPKPLAAYDIMMQWMITFAGFGGALFMAALFAKVARSRYTFDHETLALTLPTGTTIVPGDIDVFDKRKWHRFIVFLKLNEEHAKLGGKELRLDLLRYSPLETWIKQMFKEAHPEEYRESFPDEFAEPAAAEATEADASEGEEGKASESEQVKADPAATDD